MFLTKRDIRALYRAWSKIGFLTGCGKGVVELRQCLRGTFLADMLRMSDVVRIYPAYAGRIRRQGRLKAACATLQKQITDNEAYARQTVNRCRQTTKPCC